MSAGETLLVATGENFTFCDVDTTIGTCLAGGEIAPILETTVRDQVARGELVDLFPEWPGETFPL